MSGHFDPVAYGFGVGEVLSQIEAQPELWNQHPERRAEDSPHYGVSDIWIRYRPLAELTSPEKFKEPHFAEFYPAWHALPALHPIVFQLMTITRAVYLGGILITKIPAGGRVLPHDDRGSWHAEFMNRKLYLPIKSNDDCVNFCEDEELVMMEGDVYSFNNLVTHSVENRGDTDRITAIICLRVE